MSNKPSLQAESLAEDLLDGVIGGQSVNCDEARQAHEAAQQKRIAAHEQLKQVSPLRLALGYGRRKEGVFRRAERGEQNAFWRRVGACQ